MAIQKIETIPSVEGEDFFSVKGIYDDKSTASFIAVCKPHLDQIKRFFADPLILIF